MNLKTKYKIVNIFLSLLTIIAFVILYETKEVHINNILKDNLKLNKIQLNAIDKHFKIFSSNINKFIINDKEVLTLFAQAKEANISQRAILRDELYHLLEKKYTHLQGMGIRQIHFHLPDNTSFLRMHKPKRFGDDLTLIRYSVKKTNETLKPFYGFEEGRIVNGFRNVFPAFDKNQNHIGSVEVSISSQGYIDMFQKDFYSNAHFLIKKSVVNQKLFGDEIKEHYKNTIESEAYYKEISLYDNPQYLHTHYIRNIKLKREIAQKIKAETSFTTYLGNNEMISLIPIKNVENQKVVAYFALYNNNSTIENIISICLILNIIVLLIFSLFLAIARKWYFSSLEIENAYLNILEKSNEIKKINNNLEEKIKQEVAKNKKKDEEILHSRLVQMGEVISMIAHQWRQPLTAISNTSSLVEFKAQNDTLKKETIINKMQKISQYTAYLSQTIEDFRTFFKPNKDEKMTSYSEVIEDILNIVQISLEMKNIKLLLELNNEERFKTYDNGLKQVFLNLIKNAEDVLIEKEIKNPYIKISTYKDETKHIIKVSDNGGGIDESIIKNIFDAYFSTKLERNGSGLGLYMSKIIIEEHCHGKLTVENTHEGASFRISFDAESINKRRG